MSNEKKINPELWKPIGFKPVELKTVQRPNPNGPHSFLGYVKDIYLEPYEVRGIMSEAPEESKRRFKRRD